MSVKERLKKYILSKNMKISQFEKSIGASNGYVNSITKGIGGEKLEKIREAYPDLDIKWLLNDFIINSKIKEEYDGIVEIIENKNGNKYVKLSDETFDLYVKTLPFEAYASYTEALESGIVYEDMETTVFNVDKYGKGNYMSFISKGDSMNGGKINDTPDKAKMLGRELGKHLWKDGFSETEYGWVLLTKSNIFHKDIIDFNFKTGELTLHSRNPSPEYSDFKISIDDVYQIFKVIKRIF